MMKAGTERVGPVARLAVTRVQLQQLLATDESSRASGLRSGVTGQFPRSATFRLLLSGRGTARSGILLWCVKALFNRVIQGRR